MVRHSPNRRGVVILIVLSLLVLFVLLVVTYAIVAGQYRRAAVAVGRQEWLGEDPQKTADRVMYDLLRGPAVDRVGSSLRGHELLRDLYGVSVRGTVSGVPGLPTPLAGGQIVQFNFTPAGFTPRTLNGFYNGSVLTFVDGPLQGVSTRVVGYATTGTPPTAYTLRIVNASNDGTNNSLPLAGNAFVLNGKPFVGTGFGLLPPSWKTSTKYHRGTYCQPTTPNGFRYIVENVTNPWTSGTSEPAWPTTPGTTVMDGTVEWRCCEFWVPRLTDNALKPNRMGDSVSTLLNWAAGGANESYDAADYQNLILAAVDSSPSSPRVLPSFHRPELLSYWFAQDTGTSDPLCWNKLGSLYTGRPAISLSLSPPNVYTASLTSDNYQFRRRLLFRPMPWEHPNFTGSNAAFDPFIRTAEEIDNALVNGPWDVDNDGDGTADSIWIDPDLPIQTTEDGRAFRPLVAIHCVDLDGRLNVNAHGNYAHITDAALNLNDPTLKLVPNGPMPNGPSSVALAGNMSSDAFPKGQGYGPPEINPWALIAPPQWMASTVYAIGDYCQPTTRNGFSYVVVIAGISGTSEPIWPSSLGATVTDGSVTWQCRSLQSEFLALLQNRYGTEVDTSTTPWTYYHLPGAIGFDPLAEFKFFEYPRNYTSTAPTDITSFFSNMDLRGQFAFGVDHFGQPLYEYLSPTINLLSDSPYEFSPARPSAYDAPYTVAELERVLRYRDFDAGTLDSRLQNLLTVLNTDASARRCITTDSYDLPVPAVVGTDDYYTYMATLGGASSVPVPQSILDLLRARLLKGGVSDADVDGEIERLLFRNSDLTMGLKLDLNRPFGNGRDSPDSNGNYNYIVDEPAETADAENTIPRVTATAWMPIDPGNDGVLGNSDGYLARQLLARHLYVLAMLLKDEDYDFKFDDDDTNDPKETARVLAQWAINVVDFRDPDSIMTPFEYDINPFNGWQDMDGNPATDEGGERGLVWGCERPELLITEALAFHDRRTEDLASDPSGKLTTDTVDPDEDFDQRLRPRGALFVELYNPWTGNDRRPAEFYHDTDSWKDGVLLDKKHLGTTGSPVWRLAITKDDKAEQPTSIERTVYFTDPKDLGNASLGDSVHYFNKGSGSDLAPLVPGRYAVIGPAHYDQNNPYRTTIGRRTDAAEGGNLHLDETRQIILGPQNANYDVNQVRMINNLNPPATGGSADFDSPWNQFSDPAPAPSTLASPQDIKPAIAVPVGSVRMNATTSRQIPLSISEPKGGYTATDWDPALADGEGAYTTPLDVPLDDLLPPNERLVPPGNKTTPNFRHIHLQRLANPTQPYHADANPYLTIDVMPVGLTVFNGVTSDPPDFNNPDDTKMLKSLQRGRGDAEATDPKGRRLWPQERQSDDVVGGMTDTVHKYECVLDNTLGYLNAKYEPRFSAATAPAPNYVGAPMATDHLTDGYPFPWLPWNNRPFVSPTELLLVPRSSPAALLADFDIASGSEGEFDDKTGRFPHLLGLFHTGCYNPSATPPRVAAANLYRLFEYVTVPSRFLGTETRLNPRIFADNTVPGTELRRPPFNVISEYREPGRINLNTIYDSRVWGALWGPQDPDRPELDHQHPDFNAFVENRRGYLGVGGLFAIDPTKPSFFMNPYRASGSPLVVPPDVSGGLDLARLEVDSTMFRTGNVSRSLTTQPASTDTPGYLNSFPEAARHSNRNVSFSYQALQRLSNLVTCRSNVYALWLTIGYFEVEWKPHPVTGEWHWELGQEVGIDTGTVKRHRAFYIIDRSIPVAFEPGQNHNVDKCVLLRRFIE